MLSSRIGGATPGSAGCGTGQEEFLDAARGEEEDHLGRVVTTVAEAVPSASRDEEETGGTGGHGLVAVEELQLPGDHVERLVVIVVDVRFGSAFGRHRCFQECQCPVGLPCSRP